MQDFLFPTERGLGSPSSVGLSYETKDQTEGSQTFITGIVFPNILMFLFIEIYLKSCDTIECMEGTIITQLIEKKPEMVEKGEYRSIRVMRQKTTELSMFLCHIKSGKHVWK